MDTFFFLKAGFMGFSLSLGMIMLVFFLVARFGIPIPKNFHRVFVTAAIASFIVVDIFLYYKIRMEQIPQAQPFLAACVGGWAAGIFSGLTNLKNLLLRF